MTLKNKFLLCYLLLVAGTIMFQQLGGDITRDNIRILAGVNGEPS
jgi:hypothetical protein